MQVLFLNVTQIILLDVLVWTVIQLTIGYCCSKIPLDWHNPDLPFLQTFAWEQGWEIYEKLFHVPAWKHLLPNGSALYRDGFSIKNLPTSDPAYLERWLKETVRAEICHWLMILPCIFFFLWNSAALGWVMVAYAVISNLVPIIAQRYNRPRVRKLLAQLEKKPIQKGTPYVPQQELSHSY